MTRIAAAEISAPAVPLIHNLILFLRRCRSRNSGALEVRIRASFFISSWSKSSQQVLSIMMIFSKQEFLGSISIILLETPLIILISFLFYGHLWNWFGKGQSAPNAMRADEAVSRRCAMHIFAQTSFLEVSLCFQLDYCRGILIYTFFYSFFNKYVLML